VSDRPDHSVEPVDERRHPPGTEELWGESYYLDFVADSGDLAGYTRIGVYPNLGVAWWTTAVVGEGRPLISSIDHHLPMPGDPAVDDDAVMALRSDGLAVDYSTGEPLRAMSVRGRAPATALDRPSDVYREHPGSPTTVAFDLTWATDGSPYHYDVTTRYEIPCRVTGAIEVGGERIAVAGEGQRDHSWGVRDWWALGWCWAAVRLDDGTRVHWADIRIPDLPVGLGYVQHDGEVDPVGALVVRESAGPHGFPVRADANVEPGALRLEIEPRWFAPALLVADDGRISRFPRACADFRADDGRSGVGWIEWNQPEPGPAVG
jgi:hypothetical protein